MFARLITLLTLMWFFAGGAHAVHVVMTGGPALMEWEGLRIKPDRHDNWWANFVRGSTIRLSQIQAAAPKAKITWIVYKPGYITRGREDNKPYTQWIADLAKKYGVKLVWVSTAEQAIKALNTAPAGGSKIESFYYFGHSNPFAFMLDYGNRIMAVSTQYIHETDLEKIKPSIFMPNADCWSFGCYTGMSMSYWWKKFLGVPLWGNLGSTRYAPVSNGQLPEGTEKWVN